MKAIRWPIKALLLGVLVLHPVLPLRGQGAFQNLDFEAAQLPIVPPGQSGGYVAVTNALPGWSVALGGGQAAQVQHNNWNLGNVNVSIFGPLWNMVGIIDGQYTAFLQAGAGGAIGNNVEAAISQTGAVPEDRKSLQFKVASFYGRTQELAGLQVSLNGVPIPCVALYSGPNYSLMGGDITSFAGQVATLRIAAAPTPTFGYNSLLVDSILFSPVIIPEPSSFALLGAGALLLGWRLRQRGRP